ncbi:ECF transporter S component [Streptococcus oricebi]|uniref:Riboflavin transporter n=1 Tax=Streptococcus oricebi TaxID=1547447 RepID=A0ABS5B3J4_9STRE|nr:ECF transporter S component [Streptococcus oricebi]MBP2623401.1 ECF transporter S component [Streptococcus oricebi]
MTQTRKMAMIAILSASSFLLMFFAFPLLTDFFKLDFSILPILLGLLILDSKGALTILLLRSLLKLLLNNQGIETLVGLPMNMLAVAAFILIFSFIWKREQTLPRFILASLLATLALTLIMILLNYLYAVPLYATFAGFQISESGGWVTYLLALVAPFNLLQGLIWSFAFWPVQALLKPILKKYEK